MGPTYALGRVGWRPIVDPDLEIVEWRFDAPIATIAFVEVHGCAGSAPWTAAVAINDATVGRARLEADGVARVPVSGAIERVSVRFEDTDTANGSRCCSRQTPRRSSGPTAPPDGGPRLRRSAVAR